LLDQYAEKEAGANSIQADRNRLIWKDFTQIPTTNLAANQRRFVLLSV
jgi:hypothetical protein